MKKKDTTQRGTAMNAIAANQTTLGLPLVIGEGPVRAIETSEPLYTIGGIPVYHISRNDFDIEPQKPIPEYTKWGEFTHPYLMIGMPSIPGLIKLYITTINDEYYILLSSVKLDPDYCGPSQALIDITCWTPKLKNDTKQKAAERMFHAFLMNMLGLKTETCTFDNEESFTYDWSPSKNCYPVMKKIFENVPND